MPLLRLSRIWDNLEGAAHLWEPGCRVPMSHIEFNSLRNAMLYISVAVQFKKCPSRMSLFLCSSPSCCLDPILCAEFKKWPCRHVEFSGPDAYLIKIHCLLAPNNRVVFLTPLTSPLSQISFNTNTHV